MTLGETSTLLIKISALFPQFRMIENLTVPAWAEVFCDVTYEDAAAALLKFTQISAHPYPPSAPEIFAIAKDIRRNRVIEENLIEQQQRKQLEYKNGVDTNRTPAERKAWMRDVMKKAGLEQ